MQKYLNKFEDPQRPLLGPNYWLISKAGLLLPKTSPAKQIAFLWLQVATLATISDLFELYIVRSDKDTALENLKLTTVAMVCTIRANSFLIWQKRWKQVINYVTEADNYERQTSDANKIKIIDTYTKKCRRITYMYVGLLCTTFFTLVSTPFWVYLSSETLRENIRNGTEPFPHILSTWVPFDKNHFPGNWITVIYHVTIVAWGGTVIPAYDATILVIMIFFSGKMELLKERCKEIMGKDGKGVDDEFDKIIAELQQSHAMLLKNMKLFNSMVSPVMFMFVVVCSLMICASAYQVAASTSMLEAFLLTEYLVCAISQLFLFCWYSSEIYVRNEQLMMGPYESQWWAANARQKKSVMILAGQLSITHYFTAGPFTNLSLNMFVTVIKGAYSYFTLLRE